MILSMFAVDRMDTWVFRVSIAIPLVCFGGLVLWHLVAYLCGKLAKKPKTRRQAQEAARPSEPALQRAPSEQIRAGVVSADGTRHVRELLALAREDFNLHHFASCLDRCKMLAKNFSDLPEGAEAKQLAAQIKNEPDRLQQVCAALVETLAETYLELAESWLRRGETRHASASWQKIVECCPETRQAQVARERLRQLGVTENHS